MNKMPKIRFQWSLRTRIMVFTGTLFLVLTILIATSILIFVFATEQNTWRARQNEAAENAAAKVADYLQQNETTLFWLDKYEFNEIKGSQDILREVIKDNPDILEILFVDKNGNLVQGAARNQPTLANQFTILQSEWFRVANSGQKIYTRVQTSPQNESYTILAMPSQHGGVLAAQIQMDALWEKVAGIRFGTTGSIYLINQSGQVIAHPDRQIVLTNQNIRDTALFESILQSPGKKWAGETINFEGIKVVSVSTPIELTNWVVISELPQKEAYATSYEAATLIPIGIILLMAIASFIFWKMLIRLIIQPLNLLRYGASQIGQGDLAHRITIPRMDELGQVMAVFNTMAADLENQHNSLQKYAERLEHRVQERTADLTLVNEKLTNEVYERRTAEKQVRASLQEKEVLLKEIHHRVKNNLQIVSSLLNLQTNHVKHTGALRALHDSRARVHSMALIHEKLYQSESLAKIDFGEYVNSLVIDLFRSYQHGLGDVHLNLQLESIALDLDYAIPCGLILNELITNAFKYAFPNGRNGIVTVKLRASPDQTICLKVADDGVGLPVGLDIASTKSLGLRLVNNLVAQVDGKLVITKSEGTTFQVSFKC